MQMYWAALAALTAISLWRLFRKRKRAPAIRLPASAKPTLDTRLWRGRAFAGSN